MRHFYTFAIAMLLMIFSTTRSQLYGQVAIPYGNDGILIPNPTENNPRYNLDRRSWECRYLTYYFVNGTEDIPGDEEYEAVRRAFQTWSNVSNLNFLEACSDSTADIRILWDEGKHGDPCPRGECDFDGPGGILAHAFFPPPNAGDMAGDIHFDDAERWTLSGSKYDLETVALHEIGHAIGLRHSNVSGAIMEGFYNGKRRKLSKDDINGIQSIYGHIEEQIVGPSLVCEQEDYYINEFYNCNKDDYTFTWTVSSNLSIIFGEGDTYIGVENNNTAPGGLGTITVKIANNCSALIKTRTVWVGKPSKPKIRTSISTCKNIFKITDLNYNPYAGAKYQYMISVTSQGGKTFYQKTGHPISLHLPFRAGDIICLENVKISYRCGRFFSDVPICKLATRCDGDPRRYVINISPNPAEDYINIEMIDVDLDGDLHGEYTLFNKQGDIISTFSSDGQTTQYLLNNQDLENNILFLKYESSDGHSNVEKLIIIGS